LSTNCTNHHSGNSLRQIELDSKPTVTPEGDSRKLEELRVVRHPSVNSIIQHTYQHTSASLMTNLHLAMIPREIHLTQSPNSFTLTWNFPSKTKSPHRRLSIIADIFIPIVLRGAAVADGVRSLTHTRSHLGTIGILVDELFVEIRRKGQRIVYRMLA